MRFRVGGAWEVPGRMGPGETKIASARGKLTPITKNWRERIETDPQVLRGKPCVKGTRIPAALILGYLALGQPADQIIEQFPDLTPADISACPDFARDLADFESVVAA